MSPRFAVFGQPISHSRSPAIHAAFAKQCGIALDYQAIEAAPEHFTDTLAAFAADGGMGANVTLPLKELAFALAANASSRATRAGAANTLIRVGDGWHADNTDGIGLVRDLTQRHGINLRAQRVLLLGAGGAARGVAPALLDAHIASLNVVNRTLSKAQALAQAMGADTQVQCCETAALAQLQGFDIVINATSAARGGQLPALHAGLFSANAVAVDLGYGAAAEPFLRWAAQHAVVRCIDGLGMLVEQAAESFALWHGQRPDTQPVYEHLRGA